MEGIAGRVDRDLDPAAAFVGKGFRAECAVEHDAHRLLHWAGEQGPDKQYALKRELLAAYHGRAENVSDHAVLLRACETVGLDAARARAILGSEDYALAVRESEMQWQQAGITAVPAVVVNQRYLISGGQPPEAYEQALRRIAASVAEAGSPAG